MHWVAYPQEFFDGKGFSSYELEGSVLRTTGGINDGVGTSHFQVVLVRKDKEDKQVIASVYSSETGEWGDLISTPCPSMGPVNSGVLVGGSVCWLLVESPLFGILEFDLDRQRLAVIEMPEGMSGLICHFMVIEAEGGGLGFLHLSSFRLEFWKRKTDVDAGWVLGSSVELDKLLSPSLDGHGKLN
ncbi:hypothetical protein PR202_ga07068 [Eleusine coracana subsp. coracana]|uniref:F-box protein AT5G49610-like beta-propeller domain-containing protein n=1 Tax=Eleusine coracana subsp. coracana TaxID=191504 RepID=A0AAV5BYX8_ELECO|nr:hypothetical protein QOZ80_2AG0107960 [Eleusine coracana subsp. coracana]GJM90758.1 hypothetical protein PR202_ga07068 [Eleusine coracana subsp. coracana]